MDNNIYMEMYQSQVFKLNGILVQNFTEISSIVWMVIEPQENKQIPPHFYSIVKIKIVYIIYSIVNFYFGPFQFIHNTISYFTTDT